MQCSYLEFYLFSHDCINIYRTKCSILSRPLAKEQPSGIMPISAIPFILKDIGKMDKATRTQLVDDFRACKNICQMLRSIQMSSVLPQKLSLSVCAVSIDISRCIPWFSEPSQSRKDHDRRFPNKGTQLPYPDAGKRYLNPPESANTQHLTKFCSKLMV